MFFCLKKYFLATKEQSPVILRFGTNRSISKDSAKQHKTKEIFRFLTKPQYDKFALLLRYFAFA